VTQKFNRHPGNQQAKTPDNPEIEKGGRDQKGGKVWVKRVAPIKNSLSCGMEKKSELASKRTKQTNRGKKGINAPGRTFCVNSQKLRNNGRSRAPTINKWRSKPTCPLCKCRKIDGREDQKAPSDE